MSIQNLSINITGVGNGASNLASSSLDLSGNPLIGTVNITGSGQQLSDVSAYVDNLGRIKGVTNIVPTSNQVANKIAQYTITLSLTDVLYSHHFDVNAKGGK